MGKKLRNKGENVMQFVIIVLSLALLTNAAFAGEPKITETDSGYVVEYTGTPEEKKIEPKPQQPSIDRSTYLLAQIERLAAEGDQIMKLKGNETREEIQRKRDRADENLKQMKVYAEEMRVLKSQKTRELEQLKKTFAEDNARFKREHGQ